MQDVPFMPRKWKLSSYSTLLLAECIVVGFLSLLLLQM
jgi:hypothetical protein